MSTYTTLDQRAAKAAHQLIESLWDEWPGDDPASLQPVVTDWLRETARSMHVAGIQGYRLVRTANTEADEYYTAMIDSPEKDITDMMAGRLRMATALLHTLGCSGAEIQALAAWHNALAGAINVTMYHLN